MDDVETIIHKKLDYDQELRNSEIYGVDAEIYTYDGKSFPMLVVSVLLN